MSFPRYPKYKDSGVEWLGEVPEHWEVSRLKYVVAWLTTGGTPDTSTPEFWADDETGGVPWVSIGDMTREPVVHTTEKRLSAAGVAAKRLDVLPAGTLLYSMFASLGKVATLGVPAAINQAILGITPNDDRVTNAFLKHWLAFLQSHIEQFSSSNTQDNLNAGKVRAFPVVVAKTSEQAAIATFLDRETAKIDALIAEQQRLIELLQEKRQAVISHAVTKGLNPDAPMKDSGIEWLGKVPEHWETTRLDRVSDFVNGKAHEPFVHDDGRFICVTSRFISTDGEAIRMCLENLTPARHDDVLMVMSDLPNGRALARTFHVQDDRAYAINQRVCAIRPTGASPRYLSFLLNRNPWFLQNDDGLNQTHLSVSDFRKMPLVLPPIDEQESISRRIDHAAALVTDLVAHANTCIRVLQERRSALISAAVTGQIDVRGLAGSEAA